MKKIRIIALLALLGVMATSCHKTCTCKRHDGTERQYTADEVDEQGGNCSNMVLQAGLQYYSVCSWD